MKELQAVPYHNLALAISATLVVPVVLKVMLVTFPPGFAYTAIIRISIFVLAAYVFVVLSCEIVAVVAKIKFGKKEINKTVRFLADFFKMVFAVVFIVALILIIFIAQMSGK